jgi:hypothetical protein
LLWNGGGDAGPRAVEGALLDRGLVLQVDPTLLWISLVPVVKFTEAHRYFLAALQENPSTPRPPLRTGTVADFHEWKAETRAYDQARLDLHLTTRDQLQQENTAVRIDRNVAKVVRRAQYV